MLQFCAWQSVSVTICSAPQKNINNKQTNLLLHKN